MSNGLKNIQSHARAYARRERLESGQPLTGYDDDSGISGIGLTPIDDVAEQSYSTPETTGSVGAHSTPGGSSGGSTASHTGYGGMHNQGGYQNYGYQPHHGYNNSVSSTGTAGYATQQGQSSQGTSPYMGHGNRLPSVGDMGIGAIVNPAPGSGGNGV
jgi:hypothetical protein